MLHLTPVGQEGKHSPEMEKACPGTPRVPAPALDPTRSDTHSPPKTRGIQGGLGDTAGGEGVLTSSG